MTEKTEKLRYARVSALLFTIVFMAYYFYGLRAVIVTVVSVFSSVLADYLCCAAMKRKYDWADESPVMSGLLLSLMMPASVPYTVMAFAAAFMAIVCKHAFGGNKNLIFCPVCVAYIFSCLCFPSEIVRYPVPAPFGEVSLSNIVGDTLIHSYTYYLDNGASSTFSLLDLVWGKIAGPMGSPAILIILICAVALYFFGDIPTVALFSGFGANVIINVIFPVGEIGWYAVLNSLVAGSYFFVLVFMACDPRYVPKRSFSQLVYGIVFAASSYLIRRNTTIENGAVFALPLICIFRDEFDRLTNALEKLLRFLWKWIVIITKWLGKNIAKGTVALGKWIAKQFDGFCELISDKIVAAQRRSSEKKNSAETDVTENDVAENAVASEETVSESENTGDEADESKPAEATSEEILPEAKEDQDAGEARNDE